MTYGLQAFTSSGKINVDTSMMPTSLVDIYQVPTIPYGSSSSKTYPTYAGYTIYVMPLAVYVGTAGGYFVGVSIDYALGYPRITFTCPNTMPGSNGGNTYAYVYLKGKL